MELLGTKIQTLRKNKNMTQAQLAEVLAVFSQSVSKWENNMSMPDISLLPIIARFFGITMDELFILQTARIYSKATDKSTLLAVCSRDSLQVLPVCSINSGA